MAKTDWFLKISATFVLLSGAQKSESSKQCVNEVIFVAEPEQTLLNLDPIGLLNRPCKTSLSFGAS